ncbi:DUF535 family protein [Rhizobium sp. WYJ-E13]|uniref:DUF535 family protein n=1 Tax=Rhizobium sp. WYJ-E13 TaxID=2849093 RepID=UPI0020A795E0|nr:DUF535 family protein [Rhizobium sp. WYJ-E13]
MIQNEVIAAAAEGEISATPRPYSAPEIADGPRQFRFLVLWRILTFVLRARWKRGVLFWFRFAAHPLLTIRWWRFLAGFAAARAFPAPHDALLQKPLSKFLVYGMSKSLRLARVVEHFLVADRILARETMMRLWQGERLDIGVVNGRNETYTCRIALADLCGGRHEGGFAVELVRTRDKALLCTGRFTFLRQGSEGGYTFVIGSMQGPRNGKRLIVEATRDLRGVRPKEAILIVLQGLTVEGGMAYFLAVSRARQPIQYRRRKRRSMMLSAIDTFWAERSAEPEEIYGFRVPKSAIGGTDGRSRSKSRFHMIGELFH